VSWTLVAYLLVSDTFLAASMYRTVRPRKNVLEYYNGVKRSSALRLISAWRERRNPTETVTQSPSELVTWARVGRGEVGFSTCLVGLMTIFCTSVCSNALDRVYGLDFSVHFRTVGQGYRRRFGGYIFVRNDVYVASVVGVGLYGSENHMLLFYNLPSHDHPPAASNTSIVASSVAQVVNILAHRNLLAGRSAPTDALLKDATPAAIATWRRFSELEVVSTSNLEMVKHVSLIDKLTASIRRKFVRSRRYLK
jgi:hypothetical protein